MATKAKPLDLGSADVHQDAPIGKVKVPTKRTVKPVDAAKRNTLPNSAFALPSKRKFPVHDASHAKAAMARLEQQKGRLSAADYTTAKRNTLKAYKRFGITPGNAATTGAKAGTHASIRTAGLTIHVHHGNMADGAASGAAGTVMLKGVELDAGSVASGDGVNVPVWNQLAKIGSWAGHASGPFQITSKEVREMVANFKATRNQRVPIDFEHASEQDPTLGTIPTEGAPAQGWIIDLQDRGANGLWGLVEWLEPARTYVRDGKYKFFSPAIRFNSRDRTSGADVGARLTSGALTNNPFLDGMAPMAAKDTGGSTDTAAPTTRLTFAHPPNEYMPRFRAGLRMSETATARECMERVCQLEELFAKAGDVCMVEGVNLADFMPAMREMIASPLGTEWDDVFAMVKALIKAAIGDDMNEDDDEEGIPSSRNMRDTTMADDTKDITMKLGAAEAKLSDATTRLADTTTKLSAVESEVVTLRADKVSLSNEKAALTAEVTRLKGVESALTLTFAEVKAKVDAQIVELVTLRDADVKRKAADADARVEAALLTYKDTKGLTPTLKPHLLRHLESDPAGFDALYPPVAPQNAYLLRNVSSIQGAPQRPPPPHASAPPPPPPTAHGGSLWALTDKFVKEGMPLADAVLRANREFGTRAS